MVGWGFEVGVLDFAKLQNMFCVMYLKETIRLMPNQLSNSIPPWSNLWLKKYIYIMGRVWLARQKARYVFFLAKGQTHILSKSLQIYC